MYIYIRWYFCSNSFHLTQIEIENSYHSLNISHKLILYEYMERYICDLYDHIHVPLALFSAKSYWSPSQSSNETSMMLLFNQCICYFLCLEHSSPDSHIIHIFTLFWSLHFILVTIERPSMITLHKIILQLYSYQSLFFFIVLVIDCLLLYNYI